jgi:hypothetical protein
MLTNGTNNMSKILPLFCVKNEGTLNAVLDIRKVSSILFDGPMAIITMDSGKTFTMTRQLGESFREEWKNYEEGP